MEVLEKLIFPDEASIKTLAASAKISETEAAVFYNRGFTTPEAIREFFDMNLSNLHNPLMMLDCRVAAEVICDHIRKKHQIVVYSDYDADGWGGAVVGYEMLSEMGNTPGVFTNTREMGFGAKISGIDKILEKWPETKLIITADNGIVAYDAIDYANSKGIDVVVTDHHQPADDGVLPNSKANVNPHRDGDMYPCKALCGAGVIWKVLSVCYVMMGIPSPKAHKLLDVVALSTVADVVPLIGENRIIVKYGLKLITDNARPQWQAFKTVFGGFAPITEVSARTISFAFGPGINALSRMQGNADKAIKMFIGSYTPEELKEMSEEIFAVNEERKILTKDQTNGAMVLVEEAGDLPVVIINHEEFMDGIVGLIAGRVREAVNRPTIVLTKDEHGNWKGSGRSIPDFPIKDTLDIVQKRGNVIVTYGGHAQACGLTVADDKLEAFKKLMIEEADKLPDEAFIRKIRIDALLKDGEITNDLFDKLHNMEPFGNSFEEPIIMVKDVYPKEVTASKNGKHVFFNCRGFKITSWYGLEKIDKTKIDDIDSITAYGRLERDEYGIKLFVDPEAFTVHYSR